MTIAPLLALTLTGSTMHTITLNPDKTRQTIANFGASDSWTVEPLMRWPETTRKKVAELLFDQSKGAGLSAWRFNLGGGLDHDWIHNPLRTVDTYEVSSGKYDWSRCPGQQWMLNAAKTYKVPQIIAYSITGPRRLTRNGHTIGTDGEGTSNLKPGAEPDYAKYLVDITEHFRSFGHPITVISPINEPDWEWNGGPGQGSQEGSRSSNEDIRNVTLALTKEIRSRSLPIRVLTPESSTPGIGYSPNKDMTKKYKSAYGDYLDMFASQQEWLKEVNPIYAYHDYWGDHANSMIEQRRKLREAINRVPGLEVWQTEYCQMQGPRGEGGWGRDLGMTMALNLARLVHYDMTLVEANAWQWWLGVSDSDYKDGLVYVDDLDKDDGPVYASKALFALGNYSRYIRPGYQRIEVSGMDDDLWGLMTSAYVSPKKNELVVVCVNYGGSSQDVKLNLSGFTKVTPYVTSDTPGDDCAKKATFNVSSSYRVPARSVVTLLCKP